MSPKWDNPTGNRGHQGFWTSSQDHATAAAPDPTHSYTRTDGTPGVAHEIIADHLGAALTHTTVTITPKEQPQGS